MAFGDMMSNLGSSAKGMIFDGGGEKAIIFLPNPNYFDPDKGNTRLDVMNTAAEEIEKDLLAGGIAGAAGSVMDNAKNALGNAANKAGNSKGFFGKVGDYITSKDPNKVAEEYDKNDKFMKVVVQFNPQSIRMDSLNGSVQDINSGDVNKLVQQKDFLGRTKMSFDLIFDDVDPMDAFMLNEVANLNMTSLARKGMNMAEHAGNTFSVTKRMEAFMSLLATNGAQHVIFFWSKMTFRGQVTGVSNKYTMFNTSGNPIRGTMHLEITQDASKTDAFEYENKSWDKSYHKVFSQGRGGGTSTLSKLTNNSILNI